MEKKNSNFTKLMKVGSMHKYWKTNFQQERKILRHTILLQQNPRYS